MEVFFPLSFFFLPPHWALRQKNTTAVDSSFLPGRKIFSRIKRRKVLTSSHTDNLGACDRKFSLIFFFSFFLLPFSFPLSPNQCSYSIKVQRRLRDSGYHPFFPSPSLLPGFPPTHCKTISEPSKGIQLDN